MYAHNSSSCSCNFEVFHSYLKFHTKIEPRFSYEIALTKKRVLDSRTMSMNGWIKDYKLPAKLRIHILIDTSIEIQVTSDNIDWILIPIFPFSHLLFLVRNHLVCWSISILKSQRLNKSDSASRHSSATMRFHRCLYWRTLQDSHPRRLVREDYSTNPDVT